MGTLRVSEKCPHALLVPCSGQGHVSSCMLLARALAEHGFKVTFVYFSSYYAKLKASNQLVLPHDSPCATDGQDDLSSQPSTASTTIPNGNGLVEIHVVEDGFAPGDLDKLFFVTPTMKENLFHLILELRERGTPPTCLVSDGLFMPWNTEVSKRAGIPCIGYWTSNAFSYASVFNLPSLYSQHIFPETGSSTQWKRKTPLLLDHIPGLPPFSSELYPVDMRFGDGNHPFVSLLSEVAACAKSLERIFIHTVEDFEVDAFQAVQMAGVSAYGIGPLLHYAEKPHKTASSSQAGRADSLSWLDTQADASVIYIAFGSLASLSVEEVQELAVGLEASGSPFLWALREDILGGLDLTEVLPKGFKERTSERGIIKQ